MMFALTRYLPQSQSLEGRYSYSPRDCHLIFFKLHFFLVEGSPYVTQAGGEPLAPRSQIPKCMLHNGKLLSCLSLSLFSS